jgi:hypothetical protein
LPFTRNAASVIEIIGKEYPARVEVRVETFQPGPGPVAWPYQVHGHRICIFLYEKIPPHTTTVTTNVNGRYSTESRRGKGYAARIHTHPVYIRLVITHSIVQNPNPGAFGAMCPPDITGSRLTSRGGRLCLGLGFWLRLFLVALNCTWNITLASAGFKGPENHSPVSPPRTFLVT